MPSGKLSAKHAASNFQLSPLGGTATVVLASLLRFKVSCVRGRGAIRRPAGVGRHFDVSGGVVCPATSLAAHARPFLGPGVNHGKCEITVARSVRATNRRLAADWTPGRILRMGRNCGPGVEGG
jgi:hypothetical protein